MLPTYFPDEREFDRGEPGYAPQELKARIEALMEAQTIAQLRGYDLMAKLYESEWEMLFLRYVEALRAAERGWHQTVQREYNEPLLRKYGKTLSW